MHQLGKLGAQFVDGITRGRIGIRRAFWHHSSSEGFASHLPGGCMTCEGHEHFQNGTLPFLQIMPLFTGCNAGSRDAVWLPQTAASDTSRHEVCRARLLNRAQAVSREETECRRGRSPRGKTPRSLFVEQVKGKRSCPFKGRARGYPLEVDVCIEMGSSFV